MTSATNGICHRHLLTTTAHDDHGQASRESAHRELRQLVLRAQRKSVTSASLTLADLRCSFWFGGLRWALRRRNDLAVADRQLSFFEGAMNRLLRRNDAEA
jgi:hypothetical protein